MSDEIVNKVAESGLITLDLESFYPSTGIKVFDLADHLFRGLILKEKDFREGLKNLDWGSYRDHYVALHCTADAIIPPWAYMLVVSYLEPIAKEIIVGTVKEAEKQVFLINTKRSNLESYRDQRVVVKGCGDRVIDDFAYAEITKLLRPLARAIMYGEPCSTVPVYKRKP